jgi:hypothetical protein
MPEIRDLQVTLDGVIYAAAVGGGYSMIDGGISGSPGTAQGAATTTITVTASPGGPEIGQNAGAPSKQTTPQSTATVSQPIINVAGLDRSELLRIGADLQVETIWKSDSEGLLALTLPGPGQTGVLFATDNDGRIYSVNPDRQVTLVTQTDHGEITQLVTIGGIHWISTAHAGNLLRFSSEPSTTGSYISTTHDAKSAASWGQLSWQSELPNGAKIEFRTRSGNSAQPDTAWSDWSEPIIAEDGTWRSGPIASPPARYIQWKAELRGRSESSPSLHGVRLTYLPRNRAPRIDSIEVSATSGDDLGSSSETSTGASVGDTSSAYSITVTDSGAVSSSTSATSGSALTANPQRKLKIAWTASDPDSDDLLAALSFRGDGESAWKLIKDEIKEKSLTIDSDALADGTYRFRIEVSDSRSNPPDKARSALRVSEPVIVDHTPPAVRLLGIDAGQVIRFEAQDAASMLRRAEYSVDAGSWVPILADDGIVDSPSETFTIRLKANGAAEHLVTLRVHDRGGNTGLGKAVVQ